LKSDNFDIINKMSQQFQGSLGSTPRQSLASSLSCEEGNIIDYDLFVQKETDGSIHELPRTKEYYFQDYPYSKPTQAEFDRREVTFFSLALQCTFLNVSFLRLIKVSFLPKRKC